MQARRTFLRTAVGLIVGFPFIIRGQIPAVPGAGVFVGAAGRRRVAAGGGGGGEGTGTEAVASHTLGTLRNNFTGTVGMQFDIGPSDVHVTALGRWIVSGNSASHVIHLMTNGGSDIVTATLNTSGLSSGQFHYIALGAEQTLTNNGVYRIESAETNGGDQWYDLDSTATLVDPDLANNGHSVNGSGAAGDNSTYGPVSFKYHL